MALTCIFLFAAILVMSTAEIPDSRILQVTPECGSNGIEDALINIVTDLDIEAKAECANDVSEGFSSSDNVVYALSVSYPGHGSNPCVFEKRQNTHVYVAKVIVSYGEPGQFVHKEQEEFTITCTFDPKTIEESSDTHLDDALIAPHEIQTLHGDETISDLDLQLIDVLGNDIAGRQVWRSRKVQLKATTSGHGGELGIRPVSCDAIGQSDEKRYAIIRAGCGDGIIFAKDKGFTTEGLSTKSPFFESFGIEDSRQIRFECNFTVCSENCDGDSCYVERRRRSGSNKRDVDTILVASRQIKLAIHKPSPPIASRTRVMDVQELDHTLPLSEIFDVYWVAIACVGILVATSLAMSLIICFMPRRIQNTSVKA